MDDDHRRWHDVGGVDEVEGPPWPVATVGDMQVRLVRSGGGVVAVGATCPHQDSPLSFAEVEDGVLACPRHWYTFDLETGRNLQPGWPDCRLPVHDTRIVDGRVEVSW